MRLIEDDLFEKILSSAGLQHQTTKKIVKPDATKATGASNLLLSQNGNTGQYKSSPRRSSYSKTIGDSAGELVHQIVANLTGVSSCVHRAAIGETPGWDIDYVNASGELHRVAVKGTQAAAFRNIEITANELEAANSMGQVTPHIWSHVACPIRRASRSSQIQPN